MRQGGNKAARSIKSEFGNLTAESILEDARDPLATVRGAIRRGDRAVRAEAGNAIEQLKKEEGYKALQRALLGIGKNALLEAGPPPVICHDVSGSVPVYFVNGITSPLDLAKFQGMRLGERLNRTVLLIHNPTAVSALGAVAGLEQDLEECTLDRAWPATVWNLGVVLALSGGVAQHNQTTRYVAHKLFNFDGRIDIVCHSQGTMIVRNALLTCGILGKSLDDIHVVFTGSPLGDDEFFPSPGKMGPGKMIVKRKDGDPVVESLGFQGVFENGQNVVKHDFVLQYVELISDDDFF